MFLSIYSWVFPSLVFFVPCVYVLFVLSLDILINLCFYLFTQGFFAPIVFFAPSVCVLCLVSLWYESKVCPFGISTPKDPNYSFLFLHFLVVSHDIFVTNLLGWLLREETYNFLLIIVNMSRFWVFWKFICI